MFLFRSFWSLVNVPVVLEIVLQNRMAGKFLPSYLGEHFGSHHASFSDIDFLMGEYCTNSSSHKAAFIFIANLAAADMLMVVVELCVAYLQFITHYATGSEIALELNLDDISYELVQSRRRACNWQVGLWMFSIAHTLGCSLLITVDRLVF